MFAQRSGLSTGGVWFVCGLVLNRSSFIYFYLFTQSRRHRHAHRLQEQIRCVAKWTQATCIRVFALDFTLSPPPRASTLQCFQLVRRLTFRVIASFRLGTFLSKPEECDEAIKAAFSNGYHLVDTAAMYQNETDVGASISSLGMKRDDFYVVTKLLPTDMGGKRATLEAAELSLKKLGLEYVDLYLIHNPKGLNCVETLVPFCSFFLVASTMERLAARDIGNSSIVKKKRSDPVTPSLTKVEGHA